MTIGVVIAAAGRGSRLGAAHPKALLLLRGETLLSRSLRLFLGLSGVTSLAAVVSDRERFQAALGALDARVRLVAGGAERQDSVRAGLAALEASDVVLIHDAARPLADVALVERVVAAAARHGAAVPCLPIPDTVKRVGASGLVVETVARESLRLAQTPQGFRAELIRRAHDAAHAAGRAATDDAALVEALGHPVVAVEGSRRNIKITSPGDLRLAEALLAEPAGDAHE